LSNWPIDWDQAPASSYRLAGIGDCLVRPTKLAAEVAVKPLGRTHGETPLGGAWSAAAFNRALRLEPLHSTVAEVPYFRHVEVDNTSVPNEKRKITYAWVSAPDQDLDGQIAALRPQQCQQRGHQHSPAAREATDKLGTGDMHVLGNGTGLRITERFHVRRALLTAPNKPFQDLAAPIDRRFTTKRHGTGGTAAWSSARHMAAEPPIRGGRRQSQ
jgi:hypothetical protein